MESCPRMTEVSGLSSDEAHSRSAFGSTPYPTLQSILFECIEKILGAGSTGCLNRRRGELCLHEYVEALVIAVLFDIHAVSAFFGKVRTGYTDQRSSHVSPEAPPVETATWSGIPCGQSGGRRHRQCHSVKSCELTCACWKVPFLVDQLCLRGSRYPSKPGRVSKPMRETDSTGEAVAGSREQNSNQV